MENWLHLTTKWILKSSIILRSFNKTLTKGSSQTPILIGKDLSNFKFVRTEPHFCSQNSPHFYLRYLRSRRHGRSYAHVSNAPSTDTRRDLSVGRLLFGRLWTLPSFSNFLIRLQTVCRSGELFRSLNFVEVPKTLIGSIILVIKFHQQKVFFNRRHGWIWKWTFDCSIKLK